jgi:hypothetical protein
MQSLWGWAYEMRSLGDVNYKITQNQFQDFLQKSSTNSIPFKSFHTVLRATACSLQLTKMIGISATPLPHPGKIPNRPGRRDQSVKPGRMVSLMIMNVIFERRLVNNNKNNKQ